MRIGMVLEQPFPPDIRVEKEMKALKKGNHELYLLCRSQKNQPAEEQLDLGIIVRIPDNSKRSHWTELWEIVYQRLTTRSMEWESAIFNFIKNKKIEAIHVHDLPLAPSCISAAKKAKIPVVVDLHEIYPEMVRFTLSSANDVALGKKQRVQFFLQPPKWWDKVEKNTVQNADRVIVVIDESKKRFVGMGIDENKISVVLNATDIDEFLKQSESLPSIEKQGFTCCYVGGVDNPNRGLHNLIKAWPLVLKTIPNSYLWLVGDGWIRSNLEKLVSSMNLSDSIRFWGQVPFSQVGGYIKAADVAIIPHVVNAHTNNTIPHKLFQYIALGKIVIASDIKPIRRILEDTGAGVIAEEWSPIGFANAIIKARNLLQTGSQDLICQNKILKEKYGFQTMVNNLNCLYNGLKK